MHKGRKQDSILMSHLKSGESFYTRSSPNTITSIAAQFHVTVTTEVVISTCVRSLKTEKLTKVTIQ